MKMRDDFEEATQAVLRQVEAAGYATSGTTCASTWSYRRSTSAATASPT